VNTSFLEDELGKNSHRIFR